MSGMGFLVHRQYFLVGNFLSSSGGKDKGALWGPFKGTDPADEGSTPMTYHLPKVHFLIPSHRGLDFNM